MMAFESDSDAWHEEQFSLRGARVGTYSLAANTILITAKSIYCWRFVAFGGCP